MKIIHRIEAGQATKWGLNIVNQINSTLLLRLRFPIWFKYFKDYEEWGSYDHLEGWQSYDAFFTLRMRKRVAFPPGFKPIWYWNFSGSWQPFKKQRLLYTREQLEDGIVDIEHHCINCANCKLGAC